MKSLISEVTLKANKTNPQDELADSLDGIFLVDAGAGTGKTHTIVRRYQNLIERGVLPKDILLITFTRNAASELREKVIARVKSDLPVTDFIEAPILNFHSLCAKILKNFGSDSPGFLGINEIIPYNFSIVESKYYETELFRKFFSVFKKEKEKKYSKILLSIEDKHSVVLSAIKKLCNAGIFPAKSGWINEGDQLLKGDFEKYSDKFDEMNKPAIGKKGGEIKNALFKKLQDFKRKLFFNGITDFFTEKRINPVKRDEIFYDETQDELIEFMRDVYFSYIEFMLKKNMMSFEFSVMFAFLTLYYNDNVRMNNQFEYIMVDEFQDTDEIQFQLLLLLCKNINNTANIAVVGDWKQGIYGFRNTTIENITEFSKRISEFKNLLNKGRERITFNTQDDKIKKIIFEYNYRSSQKILNFSYETLFCEGAKDEKFDVEEIKKNFEKPLEGLKDFGEYTEIGFYKAKEKSSDDEVDLILRKISELVNDEKYKIVELSPDGKESIQRRVKYSDICVLSKTKSFGLKIQRAGHGKGIPVNYQGGMELFSTEPGILLLAWLRILVDKKNRKGWIPIFEKEGYTFDELNFMLDNIGRNDYGFFQKDFEEFYHHLKQKKDNLLFVVESILSRYGFDNEYGNAILNETGKWIDSDLISTGALVELIENSKTEAFNVELNKTADSVVTKTIHSVKGLEFPVVILSNVNSRIFPDTKNIVGNIFYDSLSGIRNRKIFGEKNNFSFIFQNFKSDIFAKLTGRNDYDEERRLLYVAVTRTKQYLYLTASNPSRFFTVLAEKTGIEVTENFEYQIIPSENKTSPPASEIKFPESVAASKKFVSVHSLMTSKYKADKTVEHEIEKADKESDSLILKTEAIEIGNRIHNIAQKIANGFKIDSDVIEVKRLQKFIGGLKATELKTETDFLFPKENRIIRGTIDLIAIYEDRIEVIDYKTDKNKNNLENYKIQIGIYKEVVKSIFKGKKVNGKIFFVSLDEIVEV